MAEENCITMRRHNVTVHPLQKRTPRLQLRGRVGPPYRSAPDTPQRRLGETLQRVRIIMKAPSLKSLRTINPDLTAKVGNQIRSLLKRDITIDDLPKDAFPNTRAWIKSCHNWPTNREIAMAAANEGLEGHGVEVGGWDGTWPIFEYINMGDTYTATLVKYNNAFYVESVGDRVEKLERRGVRIE